MRLRYMPRFLGLDLEAMANTYARENGLLRNSGGRNTATDTLPVIRDGEFLEAAPELVLREGDVVSLVAGLRTHQQAQKMIGG